MKLTMSCRGKDSVQVAAAGTHIGLGWPIYSLEQLSERERENSVCVCERERESESEREI